jgi:hypothetical protein
MSPARVVLETGLTITFYRDGNELARRTARTPERAAQMALLLIASLEEGLLDGDMMLVREGHAPQPQPEAGK